jgi:hypothetical protein
MLVIPSQSVKEFNAIGLKASCGPCVLVEGPTYVLVQGLAYVLVGKPACALIEGPTLPPHVEKLLLL